ncbi:hypothetical protein [Hymenobacter sp.]|uniref:hypothetical protein n=1 Tax=Hymenobacter sp. TaxID=1898978 RepID=UPI00286B0866|nr:hypothetical protein [Hymenobacter sp.]
MSINPIEENSTPKPTGSLEDLFRHHLGEEAAVPPRPLLWDQIDNSLLVRQNETYRRRLVATRWVAAASLLLATLAGTGWWSLRDARLDGPDMATTRPANPGSGRSGGTSAQPARSAAPSNAPGYAVGPGRSAAADGDAGSSNNSNPAAGRPYSTPRSAVAAASAGRAQPGSSTVGTGLKDDWTAGRATAAGRETTTPARLSPGAGTAAPTSASAPTYAARATPGAASDDAARQAVAARAARRTATPDAGLVLPTSAATTGAVLGATAAVASAAPAATVAAAEPAGLLAVRPAALSLTGPAALPLDLAALALPPQPDPAMASDAHRWHYGASYTTGLFSPNINFSRAGIEPAYDYNPALGAGSPALTEAAAAQYRENLRPGFSQRLALLATRHLGGHWSLSTGAELSQATAKSASASAFLGEQLLDLGQSNSGPLRTTNFRYRLASIPVEIRYANPVKRGWSLYGRLGGAVSALLGVRSEVEGSPESTRTYSIAGAAGPYRRVLGSVRGGAGAQLRPAAAHWTLTLGPVAELGLMPLNAHPAQSYLAQSRPYTFGVEAAVEFGR